MTEIFAHQSGGEPNVDYLSVSSEGNFLLFDGQSPGDGVGDDTTRCRADRPVVERLYNALGTWLWPTGLPKATEVPMVDPEPIYTALIRRLVTEEVARVLPLHQAPQALPPACQTPVGCVASLPEDPEPHDVGHADEPADHGRLMSELQRAAVRVPKCPTCNHFWSDHTGEMCWGHSKCGCAQERP